MTLILYLDRASIPQVPHSHGVGVFHKLFKHTTIPEVEAELDLCAHIFGVINGSEALQDDRLKSDHPL